MKKIIGVILLVLVVYLGIKAFTLFYIPSNERFDLKYSSLQRKNEKDSGVTEEKVEFQDKVLYTRTTFSKSGDTIEYQFNILNDGTLDAKLHYDPIFLKLDYYFKKHIKYEVFDKDYNYLKKEILLNLVNLR